MIDNAFMPGFIAFYKSVVKNSPKILNYKWRFIDMGLSNSNKGYMASLLHDNVEFVKPRFENYKHINMSITDDCLKNTYYKLDIFSYTDCDRVVFIDMDTIALGDLNPLFRCGARLAGVQAYGSGSDNLRSGINTGVIVVNKPYLDFKLYKNILQFSRRGFSMPDQKAINKYFKKMIHILPKEYNCEKRMWKGKKHKIFFSRNRDLLYRITNEKVRLLHFVSQKPWDKSPRDKLNKGYDELEELWMYYYRMEI